MTNLRLAIKQGDTKRGIIATLYSPSGEVIDLTGCYVFFNMGKKINCAPVTVLDPEGGVVMYSLSANAVDDPGLFRAEFVVQYPDGRQETFPNTEDIVIKINPRIGGVCDE